MGASTETASSTETVLLSVVPRGQSHLVGGRLQPLANRLPLPFLPRGFPGQVSLLGNPHALLASQNPLAKGFSTEWADKSDLYFFQFINFVYIDGIHHRLLKTSVKQQNPFLTFSTPFSKAESTVAADLTKSIKDQRGKLGKKTQALFCTLSDQIARE